MTLRLVVLFLAAASPPEIETETVDPVKGQPGEYEVVMSATVAPGSRGELGAFFEATAREMALDYWQNEGPDRSPRLMEAKVLGLSPLGEKKGAGAVTVRSKGRVKIALAASSAQTEPRLATGKGQGVGVAFGEEKRGKKEPVTQKEQDQARAYAERYARVQALENLQAEARKAGESKAQPTPIGKPSCSTVEELSPSPYEYRLTLECTLQAQLPFDRAILRAALAASPRRRIRVDLQQTVQQAGISKTPLPTTLFRTPLEEELEADGWVVVLADAPTDYILRTRVDLVEVEGDFGQLPGSPPSAYFITGTAAVTLLDAASGAVLGTNSRRATTRDRAATTLSYERTAFTIARSEAPQLVEPLRPAMLKEATK